MARNSITSESMFLGHQLQVYDNFMELEQTLFIEYRTPKMQSA